MIAGAPRGDAPARQFGFGRADEHPYRRLLGDWVRVGLAVILLVVSVRHVGTPHPVESNLARTFARFPAPLDGVLRVVMGITAAWSIGLVVAAGGFLRQIRLTAALIGAGALAWLVARVAGLFAVHEDLGEVTDALIHGDPIGRYPVIWVAVLGGVVLAAAPFLSRPVRRVGSALWGLVIVGALVRELGTTNAVFAAVVIAWGSAAAIHLVLGSPAGRPTPRQVEAALSELGVAVAGVELAPAQDRGSTRMVASADDGSRFAVRVYGRDAAETRLAAKLWRAVVYKDSGPTLTFTRLQQVEHEALCLLRAKDAEVVVPDLIAVGVAGPSAAVLVSTGVDHVAFGSADLDQAQADQLVTDAWQALGRLRVARIAHGALDADHLAIDVTGRLALTDFSMASVAGPAARLDLDVAQLLVTTAAMVGADGAVAAALAAVPVDVVADARRFLSKPALTPTNRRLLRDHRELLVALGEAITTATSREPEPPIELRRVKPLNVAMFVGAAIALWVILGQIGSLSDLWGTLRTAKIPWTVGAFIAAQSTAVAFALVTLGSVPAAVPLLPATLLQMAISFANLVAMTSVSSTVMNIRFLQKQGIEVGVATSSGVLAGLSGSVAQLTLFVLSALAVGQDFHLGDAAGSDGGRQWILIGVGIVSVAVGVVLAVPKLRGFMRTKVWPQVTAALRNFWGILTTPRQLVLVLGGTFAAQLLYSVCLSWCLHAYGGNLSFLEIVFVNSSAAFIANLTPVPGGMGIQEAAMIGGLGAFGIAPEVATAAVITHRLFTTYLPPIWGSWATKKLLADGYL